MFREAINEEWLASATLVPVPSSKIRTDADYDDRLPRILNELASGKQLDIRELVCMAKSVEQSHLAAERVSIDELVSSMQIDEDCTLPPPRSIAIFDDVLTTGRHFKAVQRILSERFADVPIVGIFVARRAPESLFQTEE